MAEEEIEITLVVRKPCFGLPTACPACLPVYIYLKFANLPFHLNFNLTYPDSDQIPYVESGTYVAYNNEKGGVIDSLKEDGIVNLDSEVQTVPEWLSTKAMISSWLADALLYETWVGSDGNSARKVYYSDLPWLIGKTLFFKQTLVVKQQLGITKDNAERREAEVSSIGSFVVKQQLGITKDNAERREAEIYKRASLAYGALSTRLGDDNFFFDNRPTSLDAIFLGHALFTLQALPETSMLRSKLLEHQNLINYAEKLKTEVVEAGIASSSVPRFHSGSSSSAAKRPSSWSAKTKSKPKKEKTEEEKSFRRRGKFFLAAQLVAILVFLSVMGGSDDNEVEIDDDDGYSYDD